MDYILYFTRSTLKKVVRIRDGYKSTEDMRFTFDIGIPSNLKVYRATDEEHIAYELDLERSKEFDTSKQTLIGEKRDEENEWFTYLRGFKAWDSGIGEDYHSQTIIVEYNAEEKTITKIVPAAFLISSIGDVFTDTTTIYYAGAGDGYLQNTSPQSTVWANRVIKGGTQYTGGGLTGSYTEDFTATSFNPLPYGLDFYGDHRYYIGYFPVTLSLLNSLITAASLYLTFDTVSVGNFSSRNDSVHIFSTSGENIHHGFINTCVSGFEVVCCLIKILIGINRLRSKIQKGITSS